MKDILKKAIEYYFSKGFYVFPLRIEKENGKKKIINSFKWRDEKITKEKSLSMVDNAKNALALLTGRDYNVFVVDIDNKPDPDNELENILAEYGIFFKAPMVKSLSGGAHYYYSFPDGIEGSSTREGIAKNLDIRGDGGLIFVPPTTVGDGKYEWKVKLNGKLPTAPKELIKLINSNHYKERERKSSFKNVPEACLYLKKIKLSYDEWIKVGMALSELGEDGRPYWLIVSDNDFYEDTDKEINYKFDNFLKNTNKVTIASLFQIVYEHGFKLEKNTFDSLVEENDDVFFSQQQLLDALKKQYAEADNVKYSLGWTKIDEYLKLLKPQLTIVTGMPYSGKSNFLDAIMINMAKTYDWRFVVFSPESQPITEHIESLSNKISGFPLRKGISPNLPEDQHFFVAQWIANHFYIMDTTRVNRNLNYLLQLVERMKIEKDIDVFVLDPWNELEHTRPAYQSETEYVGYTLGRMKALALSLDIHIFIVAHPTKVFPEKDGQKRVVRPYDIAGSANWFNKADNVISVYRDFQTNEVEIYIQKVKRGRMGKLGVIPMEYKKETGEYI